MSTTEEAAEPVLVDVDAATGVATVTLNEPERRNTLKLETVRRIVAAFDDLEARPDEVGAVIVTGAPPAFCAGADLGNLGGSREGREGSASDERQSSGQARSDAERDREQGLRDIYEGFLRVGRSLLPTIAAVNGAAVGAGMNLALCCDVRIAARRARFDTRFLQLGLHPGGGHTWMLRNAVGPQGAAAMVLFGEVLDGEAAAAHGLAWKVVDDDALLDSARELAAKAADVPRQLARRAKQSLATMATVASHPEAVDVEIEAQVWSTQQPEFRERLKAMQEKISRGSTTR